MSWIGFKRFLPNVPNIRTPARVAYLYKTIHITFLSVEFDIMEKEVLQ